MQFPLNQFEQYIDETIRKRGLSYFKNGFVSELEEITPGVYEAIVQGTEDYTVQLKIKNGTILEHTCDCPYDMGPVCKHVVAVIFYLRKDGLELKQKPSSKKSTKEKKTERRKTVVEQVNELLDKISHEDLKQFIREKTENNPPFRNIFFSSFAHQNTSETKEFYLKQVKSILRSAAGRDGFINWSAARYVSTPVIELLNAAQKHFENKNYRSTIFICCAVMEGMTEALQYSDDSYGDIGGNIEVAYDLLSDITSEKLPEEIRKLLFEYCVLAYKNQIYSGWAWHLGMLSLASEVMKNEDEEQLVIAHLDKVQRSDYEQDRAQNIKLQILKKTKEENEVDKFIEQNLYNPSFRRETILKAIKNKNYEKAISITKDGILHDEKDKPGLAIEWYDWLLKIAIAQNNKEKIIEYARLLFIDDFMHEQDYYQLMKTNVQPENWNSFVEGIIKDITRTKRSYGFSLLARIYIKEEWWNRLLELIKQNPSLTYIEDYSEYLSKDYPVEISQLYTTGIIQFMKNSSERSHYQTVCRYLRKMIKLGAREKVNEIIAKFRKEYPRRKALMEELNRV
ncbi:MAG: SWIM zinc finger family protein [Bacteroidota bacterium]|nr:SWIM zinc finger family protein [Bacteroidota bacterium]